MPFVSLPLCTWCICQGHTGGYGFEHSLGGHFRICHIPASLWQHPSVHYLSCQHLSHTLERLWLTRRHLEQALGAACLLARCPTSRCQVVPCITLSP